MSAQTMRSRDKHIDDAARQLQHVHIRALRLGAGRTCRPHRHPQVLFTSQVPAESTINVRTYMLTCRTRGLLVLPILKA